MPHASPYALHCASIHDDFELGDNLKDNFKVYKQQSINYKFDRSRFIKVENEKTHTPYIKICQN